jgi:hypothetical protein
MAAFLETCGVSQPALDITTLMRRLAISTRRWLREQRRLYLLEFRKNWALMRSEYELVGGPLDGQVRKCHARNSFFLTPDEGGGVYLHKSDCRMHYHGERAPTASEWKDWE